MTAPLLVVSCIAAALTIAMLTDVLRDLGGKYE